MMRSKINSHIEDNIENGSTTIDMYEKRNDAGSLAGDSCVVIREGSQVDDRLLSRDQNPVSTYSMPRMNVPFHKVLERYGKANGAEFNEEQEDCIPTSYKNASSSSSSLKLHK